MKEDDLQVLVEEEVSGKINEALDPLQTETEETEAQIKFQAHESGLMFYVIPLTSEDGEKLDLRIFQTYSAGRLEFETYNEYVIRRKFMKEEEKRAKKRKALIWDSVNWGSMNPINALKMLEQLNQNPDLSDEQRRKILKSTNK